MASAAIASSKQAILPLLTSPHRFSNATTAASFSKRSFSVLTAKRGPSTSDTALTYRYDICGGVVLPERWKPSSFGSRSFSKYITVNHTVAYENAMNGSHGIQLQLALEEGRGKDDAPFDPFSLFLDQMGNVDDQSNTDSEDDIMDQNEKDYEHEEDYDEASTLSKYTNSGDLRLPLSQRRALRAGYPAGGKFAVILLAGFQHKVTANDLLVVNKLKPVSTWSVGSTHTIRNEDVLLMADNNHTLIGLPGVKGGEVDLMVEEITRDKTVIVFKKRRRKNSRRKNGFRRQVTFLRVLDVRMPGEEMEGEREREEMRVAA